METDNLLANAKVKFFLRADFAVEFCFEDELRRPLTPEEEARWYPDFMFTPKERAAKIAARRHTPLPRYYMYMGAIHAGKLHPTPVITDGSSTLAVAEPGLYRAMLNRLSDGLKQPRNSWPAIYPASLTAPKKDDVWAEWVVLHDSERAEAGLVQYIDAINLLGLF